MGKRFKWVVEFEVDETWVADGFELTDSRALEMIANDLTHASYSEFSAHVIKAPNPTRIRKAQGYEA